VSPLGERLLPGACPLFWSVGGTHDAPRNRRPSPAVSQSDASRRREQPPRRRSTVVALVADPRYLRRLDPQQRLLQGRGQRAHDPRALLRQCSRTRRVRLPIARGLSIVWEADGAKKRALLEWRSQPRHPEAAIGFAPARSSGWCSSGLRLPAEVDSTKSPADTASAVASSGIPGQGDEHPRHISMTRLAFSDRRQWRF
jgi:hypothetical protein